MWLATYIHLLSRLHIKNGDVVSWEYHGNTTKNMEI